MLITVKFVIDMEPYFIQTFYGIRLLKGKINLFGGQLNFSGGQINLSGGQNNLFRDRNNLFGEKIFDTNRRFLKHNMLRSASKSSIVKTFTALC